MWRIVAILALSLSGCVSTKSLDQAFGAGQGRQIVKSEIAFLLSGQVSPPVRGEHQRENESQRKPEQDGRHR
jgi:hypothetical protein